MERRSYGVNGHQLWTYGDVDSGDMDRDKERMRRERDIEIRSLTEET
jgi:hypothetical protein